MESLGSTLGAGVSELTLGVNDLPFHRPWP